MIWEELEKALSKVGSRFLIIDFNFFLIPLFLKTGRGGSKIKEIQSSTYTKIQVNYSGS